MDQAHSRPVSQNASVLSRLPSQVEGQPNNIGQQGERTVKAGNGLSGVSPPAFQDFEPQPFEEEGPPAKELSARTVEFQRATLKDAEKFGEALQAHKEALGKTLSNKKNRAQDVKALGSRLGAMAAWTHAQNSRGRQALSEAHAECQELLSKTSLAERPRLLKALRDGFAQGRAEAFKEWRSKAIMSPEGVARFTDLDDWQERHGSALASQVHIADPSPHTMKWSWKHGSLLGVGKHEDKVKFALSHLTARSNGADLGSDMRPLMQAGVQLAKHNGREYIAPHQAIELMDVILEQAGGEDLQYALTPDELRMFTAGLVAVWDHQTSAEVALHLLDKAASGNDSAHVKAMAEGLGIGMGWKGMGQVHEFAKEQYLENMPAGVKDMLASMDKGQAIGRDWLGKLEMSLSRMQGHGPQDHSKYLRAVILLRKHFIGTEQPPQEQRSTDFDPIAHKKKKDELLEPTDSLPTDHEPSHPAEVEDTDDPQPIDQASDPAETDEDGIDEPAGDADTDGVNPGSEEGLALEVADYVPVGAPESSDTLAEAFDLASELVQI